MNIIFVLNSVIEAKSLLRNFATKAIYLFCILLYIDRQFLFCKKETAKKKEKKKPNKRSAAKSSPKKSEKLGQKKDVEKQEKM